MALLHVLTVCGCLLALAYAQKKCCVASNWQSAMTNTSDINSKDVEFSQFYTDYKMKVNAIQHFKLNPGGEPTPIYRVVNDYEKKKTFYIPAKGKCVPLPNNRTMPSPCVPDDAEHLGTSYVGFPMIGVAYDGWRFKIDDLTVTIAITPDNCVPLIEGVKGPQIDVVYFFNQFETPIKDRSVFKVPSDCGM